jgi:ParB family chromosome partitioning protein
MAKPRKRKALGKGLDAILGGDIAAETTMRENLQEVTSTQEIPLEQIEINPFQPRTEFDPVALEELADSIKVHGIIQPLTLRKLADKQYQLIAGERRLRASKIAGLAAVPAYIRTADDEQMLEMALIENIQREDLNPIEIAVSYQRMIKELGLKQDSLGEKVGKKRATITNYLRLLKLQPDIQDALRNRKLSMGHGRALISIEDPALQSQVYENVIDNQLSVRQTEAMVKKLKNPPAKKAPAKKEKPEDIHLRKVARDLEERFGSKVRLSQNDSGKGEIVISYNSLEDLNRIIELLEE